MELSPEIVTIFSLIVSGVLVGIVIFQYRLLLKQYETVNRPWLIFEKTNQSINEDYVIWSIENIGNIPAKEIKIGSKCVMKNSIEEVIHSKVPGLIGTSVIMPKQKFTFVMNDITFADIMQPDSLEVSIFLKYQFFNHKKTSEFSYSRHNGVDHEKIHCVSAD